MGVSFYITAEQHGRAVVRCICDDAGPWGTCPACQLSLDLNLHNAADLLEYLGLAEISAEDTFLGVTFPSVSNGAILAAQLVSLCERRLAMADAEEEIPTTRRGRVIVCGRSAGYLRARTEQLLRIARSAGAGWVAWS